jgi:hypothetical protein
MPPVDHPPNTLRILKDLVPPLLTLEVLVDGVTHQRLCWLAARIAGLVRGSRLTA